MNGRRANRGRQLVAAWFLLLTFAFVFDGRPFSLLGPLRNQANGAANPWQGVPYGNRPGGLGYSLPGDIGGPRPLQEGYRWNVPLVTYGFDSSFVSYFGQEGIAEVEKAIATLNALPAASAIELTGYPLETKGFNLEAESLQLLDLNSHVLALLLEQMGLAKPERFVWALRARDASPSTTNYVVLNLNYDPVTFRNSSAVNGINYQYVIMDALGPGESVWASAVEWFVPDPLHLPHSSVAGGLVDGEFYLGAAPNLAGGSGLGPGQYFNGLTRDDIGGLRFLLSSENAIAESLPPGVLAAGPDPSAFIPTAVRPGVEKIAFARHEYSAQTARFLPFTNRFQDVTLHNGLRSTQSVQRVVRTPDFLFRAADLGGSISDFGSATFFTPLIFQRSDSAHWTNHAALNGRPGGGGPGVILPPVEITLNTLATYSHAADLPQWGAFGLAADAPYRFLGQNSDSTATRIVRSRIVETTSGPQFEWTFLKRTHWRYLVETSTDLVNWSLFTDIEPSTNSANAVTMRAAVTAGPGARYFRVVSASPF
jgi:hypothetical protein